MVMKFDFDHGGKKYAGEDERNFGGLFID